MTAPSRAFYAAESSEFLRADSTSIVGQLAQRHVGFHASAEAEQIRAWAREIEILKSALSVADPLRKASVLLEMPLLRLGKRLDAVIVAPGVALVVEFKIGAAAYENSAIVQTERYACCLRDFHEASQTLIVVPVLCCERAPRRPLDLNVVDGVANTLFANADTLPEALSVGFEAASDDAIRPTLAHFDHSPYRPTPTIVEASRALYAGHQIADIGRGDAADQDLQETAKFLHATVRSAAEEKAKVICFVTGAPGAGKTLLGLDLALASRVTAHPAALLSGNRPLVHVLTEALAEDHANRHGVTKDTARHQTSAAIQNLLGYLKEHTDGAVPPEHVIVFDEAQRAWDENVGQELMGRPMSEPELFLDILDRLDWSCLVCLVGPGQEINRGEGGLPLWGAALGRARSRGRAWKVVAAPQALDGGAEVTGGGLLQSDQSIADVIVREPRLHLANAIRSYRNPLQGKWVAALLVGNIAEAQRIAMDMPCAPVLLTRDLDQAKAWLRARRGGGRSVGLLTSSGATRLIADGVPLAPRSNELGPIAHWFLKPFSDFRSASAIEIPMSEFGCQGLELDYACVCWGGDLVWKDGGWVPRMMRAPRWQTVHDIEKQRFRLNGYRVLLTRARAGAAIYIPRGSVDDPTRAPDEADAVADTLFAAGGAWRL